MTSLGAIRIGCAIGFLGLWTLATWWFEGRIGTFARPDAVVDRLIYTGVVNILIGVVAAAVLLRILTRGDPTDRSQSGFASWRRTVLWAPIGFATGFGLYLLQGAPSADPVVLLNAYAQVLVVSMAEVIVCWALVARMVARGIHASTWVAIPVAAIVASLLFGAYHFAHSAPFNTVKMVAFLSLVGLLTSAMFFASRDVYATILFHNFLGTFGVTQAMAAQDTLGTFQTLQAPLLGTALIAMCVLITADLWIVRRSAT